MDSSFIDTFIRTFRKSFSFEGRASRKEQLVWAFVALNFMVIFSVILPTLYPNPTFELICTSFDIICFFLPSLSITIRRWHDLGYSGWFIIMSFIPIVNLFVGFFVLFRAGNKETNKYGLVPIDQNLTVLDKVWLWTFSAITILEFVRRLYLTYQLFNH
jgi:uncharacterized membrane protein YhaH (DUF805 family)